MGQTDIWVIFNRAHSGDRKDPIFMADRVTGSCAIGCTQYRWCGFILLNLYLIICNEEPQALDVSQQVIFWFLPFSHSKVGTTLRDDHMLLYGPLDWK